MVYYESYLTELDYDPETAFYCALCNKHSAVKPLHLEFDEDGWLLYHDASTPRFPDCGPSIQSEFQSWTRLCALSKELQRNQPELKSSYAWHPRSNKILCGGCYAAAQHTNTPAAFLVRRYDETGDSD